MNDVKPIRRALLSVSDKTGILELAQALHAQGVELLSTGGTARLLMEHKIPVIQVSEHTGQVEIMDGRVKTLHPKIHGGILARRDRDAAVMAEHDIKAIDLVVVNLYPFAKAVASPDCSHEQAIENIDIGGPTMVRASAKNYNDVTVVVDHSDYPRVLAEMQANHGSTHYQTRFDLAVAAFEHTAAYDGMIANYFGTQVPLHPVQSHTHANTQAGTNKDGKDNASSAKPEPTLFPRSYNAQFIKKQDLRYGENSHQAAAFYVEAEQTDPCVATAIQLQGKTLSYNNIADTDAALECVKEFNLPACVIVKHANPCGVALGSDLLQAYERAFKTDPTSAFGGIIAFNRELDAATASAIIENQFVEVIIAPKVSQTAREIIARKVNVRLLESGQWANNGKRLDYKRVTGGLLLQESDQGMVNLNDLKVVSKRQPSSDELSDLLFCWKVAKFVKSNAIVYAKGGMTLGIGAGQMSRVYSAKIAGIKAADEGLTVDNCVMASDAFFPFRDGIDAAAKAGVRCIIQPGGSIRDPEIIAAADEHDMCMIFTGMRHFRH